MYRFPQPVLPYLPLMFLALAANLLLIVSPARAQLQPAALTKVVPIPSSTIVAGSGLVTVTWSGGTAPYQLQVCTNLGSPWQDVAGTTSSTSQTNILTLPNAYYRLMSVGSLMATNQDTNAPTLPANLVATTIGSNEVDLAWSPSTDPGSNATGVKGYNVYRNGIFLMQVPATNTSAADVYVMPTTTNNYTVASVDYAFHQSTQSAIASATTTTTGNCNDTVTPLSASFTSAGGSSNITVTAGNKCSWGTANPVSWITITSGGNGKGNGTVAFTVAANTNANSRTSTLTIANKAVTITQAGLNCSYAVTPANVIFPWGGGASNLTVTAGSSCAWTATSNASWITITSGRTGTGNGTVGYSVAANPTNVIRAAALTVGGQVITVTEAGNTTPPSVSLTSPANGANVSGTIALTASASDSTGVRSVSFYLDNGTPLGTVTASPYTINFATATIANGAHSFYASATDAIGNSANSATNVANVLNCSYSAVAQNTSFNWTGGSSSVTVTANAGCGWTASSGASWITVGSGSGTGSGSVSFTVAGNISNTTRTGTLTVAGQTINVTQTGNTAPPSVSLTAPATGANVSGTISLTASASDSVGVSSVAFYLDNGTPLGTVTASPYNLNFDTTTIANGSHSFYAKATDAAGNSALSATDSVTVANCSYSVAPQNISFAWTGGSSNVTVTTGSGCGWTASSGASWITVNTGSGTGSGNVSVSVANNLSTTSRTGTLTVAGQTIAVTQSGDTTLPVVSLTAPASGSTVSNTITLTASATDAAGVASVTFYCDGNLVGTATTSPYTYSYSTTALANGNHTFSASAVDFAGNSATSASSTVTVNNAVAASPGVLQWVQTAATPNGYNASGESVVADSAGNVIVCGEFNNGINLGSGLTLSGSSGLFLAKYDSSGRLLWSRTMAGSLYSTARSVTVDSQNNIIVAGGLGGTVDFGGTILTAANSLSMYVAKYSSSNTLLWVKMFGGSGSGNDVGMSVAVDSSDNVILAGQLQSANVSFGSGITLSPPGSTSLALVKLSSAGTTLWAKAYGTGQVFARSIAIDRSGNVGITGQFMTSSDFGGGTISSANSGNYSTFVAKYSGSNGAYQWAKAFGGSTVDSGNGIAADPSTGNFVVTGGFQGTANFGGGAVTSVGEAVFLAGYDTSGNFLWVQTYGTSMAGSSYANSVKIDASGNLAVTGLKGNGWYTGGTWNFSSGFFTGAFTISGNTAPVSKWMQFEGSGSTGGSAGNAVALDTLGHVLCAGTVSFGTVDFGGISATTTANSQYGFIAQYTR